MDGTDSVKDQATVDRDSTNSANRLINDNFSNLNFDEQLFNQKPVSPKKTQENIQKLKKEKEPSPPQSPADKPSFRGPFGITTASTIIWYICICILFVISFICLILSVLYFVTDTTTDQALKLYGICGSGVLAIVTFVIIFLDCCNDEGNKDHEEEVLYRTLQAKEAKEREMALRRSRRIAESKGEKPKPFIIQYNRPQRVATEPPPHPPHPPHHHHHHHLPVHPPTSYHHPFVCPICHDLHASGNARHNHTDVAVDTSDKFAPVLRKDQIVHKSTRDAQTEPKLWDAERGTQTDRTEGTQTSTIELSGMPSNVTQIIHETTILKAPRNLISTLKKSMKEQDKDIAITHAVTDTYSTPKTII